VSALSDAMTLESTLLTARDQVNTLIPETVEGPANNALSVQKHIHQALKEIAAVIVGLGGNPSVSD
jgi:hypothetical protein